MGGPGSGRQPEDSLSGGRKKRTAMAVCGTGLPDRPEGVSDAVLLAWDELNGLVAGVAFSQDSVILVEAAQLLARQRAFHAALEKYPTDIDLNRVSLAIGRQLHAVLGKLGLTPRDRQVLLVPRPDEGPKDPLALLREKRGSRN